MTKARKNIYVGLTVTFSLAFVVLGVFVFKDSYLRLWEALRDLLVCFKYYFCYIFDLDTNFDLGINNPSNVLTFEGYLPKNWDSFQEDFKAFWMLFATEENFQDYLQFMAQKMGHVSKILVILLPVLLVLVWVIKQLYDKENTKHNEDTKQLVAYKKFEDNVLRKIKNFIAGFAQFLLEKRILGWWILVWVFHLNIASIVIAFVGYYFYFAASIDLLSLYMQVVKLIVDLQVILNTFPLWVWLILAYALWTLWRKNMAMRKLHHFEARNCGFINELPIVSMTCGSMGKKKTTTITDMALSQEVMFRQRAFEGLKNADMKFPFFPWICFEMELRSCMAYGVVYNLATAKAWVEKKRQRFNQHHNADWQLYGYDIEKYGRTYDDKLRIHDLFDVLSTYAQLYLIYIIQSSLIVSNYSIRIDNVFVDRGNFPQWYTDFFPEVTETDSRFAHILDFDILRLGKKMVENNTRSGSFEFGVVVISEVGKERGNNLELKEIKKTHDDANQKNDLFNSWLKMCRHSATVDNYPFIKVFTDEQRPESWGADARDLADIIRVVKAGESRVAIPFYTIEDMLSEWFCNKFFNTYYKFRHKMGNNTLFMYLYKKIASWVFNARLRNINRFGYSVLSIATESGTLDGKRSRKSYFLMNKKIYSRRFTTDCFSDYFNELASRTTVGLDDYLEYASEKATVEELQEQNSYFITSIYGKEVK